ncbi:3-deoxy-D-manno-octulosonate 8-phosphate phosphatase [Marinobacter lipolyticus SM19]|uniref:3-deoxy-D-manno-octulosonate 8-phosphate phosphatase KdsC n=1 Tax=Marinobacter lipolyticus SM19 TaxID=1318628 RepID=R8B5A8_9GAMM|nr:HAD hydrolase family protein [Marinobacter lipolyticus]EON93736.1 3-deoxy-D-manno-octulosonate 8-phosphate phosphatase [Marinobacter lipolyticus SM19]
MTDTLRPQWPARILGKAANIRLLALDVDGIMTDGKLFFSASGDEMKGFNILDGLGLKQVMAAGITVAVITGRNSPLTEKRMGDLGIPHLMQGREDKKVALQELVDSIGVSPEEIAYMGDDLPDLPAIRFAGLGITVPNGYWLVREQADVCTSVPGGNGAVREACDLLLTACGQFDTTLAAYTQAD